MDTPGLQPGGWYSLAEPSSTLHERGKPGDVDTGSRRHGSRDTGRCRKNNGWDRRQLGKFDLFSAIIRKIDLGDGRTKNCSILECLSASILQSVECPHDQLLEKNKVKRSFLDIKSKKKMVVDRKNVFGIFTFTSGKIAINSMPSKNIQRGVAAASL